MTKTIIGKKNTGKTTLANRFIINRTKPCIIVDPADQFKEYKLFLSPQELLRYMVDNGFTISKPLRVAFSEQAEFDQLCKICLAHKNILLVVDEVDMFDSPTSQSRYFKKIIHLGRHYGLDLITTSRRPASISRDLTSQTDTFYLFKVTEETDLIYFKKRNSELAQIVRELKPYYHIKYDDDAINIIPPLSV